MHFVINPEQPMSLPELVDAARLGNTISLSAASLDRVRSARSTLERFVSDGRIIYGVNTSVGGLVNFLVPVQYAQALQTNLINAVATNVGPEVDAHTTRAIILARIVSLARGHSGITVDNLQILVQIFNAEIIPYIPEKGSLGTSGDLGPLAAIALVGCGRWKARLNNTLLPGNEALDRAGIVPMALSYKEGLALINGTSGMVGLGARVTVQAQALLDLYLSISALSMEALAAKAKPFDPRVHLLKPHIGQREVARTLWQYLSDSRLTQDESTVAMMLAQKMSEHLQSDSQAIEDAYSLRCTPQVLGPVLDSLQSVAKTVTDELNSSNDNPLLIPHEDDVFHNGHFHGQYVSMAMDHLVLGLVTLCNLSDRRIDRYLKAHKNNGLPPFLCDSDAGLRLGLMGGQFMAASLTAENRSLCVPLSIQSLPTTDDFQDVVSLGFVAARRARDVLNNTRYVVAFELLCGCQAADIRGVHLLSSAGRQLYDRLRSIVPFLDRDEVLTDHLEAVVTAIADDSLRLRSPQEIHQ